MLMAPTGVIKSLAAETDPQVVQAALSLCNLRSQNQTRISLSGSGKGRGCDCDYDYDCECSYSSWWSFIPRRKKSATTVTRRSRKLEDHWVTNPVCRLPTNRSRKRKAEECSSPDPRRPRVSKVTAPVMAAIEEQGGQDVMAVVEKKLWRSDTDKRLGRFLIPRCQVLSEFLRREEQDLLDRRRAEVRVSLMEPCLETREMALRKWKIGGSFSYVLTKGWNAVVSDPRNGLVEGTEVGLWSYRVQGGRLRFALTMVSTDEKAEQDDSMSEKVSTSGGSIVTDQST